MIRFFLTVLAVLFAVRLLFSFLRAIVLGMREGQGSVDRGTAARGNRPRGAGEESPRSGDSPARRPAIDRASAIDVTYTEVEAERSAGAGGSGRPKG